VTDRDQVIGARTKIKVVKNKLAPPFRTVEVDMIYGRGLCRAGDALDMAEAANLLQKAGSWLAWGDIRLGNGRERARERLLAEPELFGKLVAALQNTPRAAA